MTRLDPRQKPLWANIDGTPAGETLDGTNVQDIINGFGGDDTLNGLDGDDFLVGGAGDDVMNGGLGNDTFYVESAADIANEAGGEGSDRVAASLSYTLGANASIETLEAVNLGDTIAMDLTGNQFDQAIVGNAGANNLSGSGGADQLVGLGDNDVLDGGTGADLMYGGTGDDAYVVDNAGDRAFEAAGEGTDRVSSAISYALDPNAAIELLQTTNFAGTDAIDLAGSNLANTIIGNAGANFLYGLDGDDTLSASGGDDFLIGGAGADFMGGGLGNDTYYVDDAGDVTKEFASQGTDRVATSISCALQADLEILEAVNSTDTTALSLTGNAAANTIIGNAGANVLDGKGDNDLLIGEGGADTFAFTSALAFNVDHIADFISGSDRIALDDAVFTGLSTGPLPAGAFVTGTSAQDADDRIIYNSTTGALFFDADGNGAGAAVQFATLDSHPVITASDFSVI